MARSGNNNIQSIGEKIKDLFQHKQLKEALIFLFFVLLATGFWFLQSLQEEYEIKKQIPIEYENIPPDIAFRDTLPQHLEINIKDKGAILLNYEFGNLLKPITIDFDKSASNNKTLQISKKEIESDIRKSLMMSSTLVSFDPQSIEIPFEKKAEKSVAVTFNGYVQTKPGYKVVGSVACEPSTIKIYGSQEALDTINSVTTEQIVLKNNSKSFKKNYALKKIRGVSYSQNTVVVAADIEQYTEKTVEVPITCLQIPAKYNLRTFPSIVKVSCSVPLSLFKTISASDFSIDLPFDEIEQNLVSGMVTLKVNKAPETAENIVISPNKIEFILEHVEK